MRPHVMLAAVLALLLCRQSAPAPSWQWADHGEYDLALAVRNQPDAKARLALIGQWKQKYPASKFAVERAELELAAAVSSGDPAVMQQAATSLLAVAPESFIGL